MNKFMKEAIKEALISQKVNGIPIGSVLVKGNEIISRGHNKRVQMNDPILHAEIDCIRNAGRLINYHGTVLYSTLMPCYMCAGAILNFKIKKVVVGESSNYTGAMNFLKNHGVEVIDLDLDECKNMLHTFIKRFPEIWAEDIGEKF